MSDKTNKLDEKIAAIKHDQVELDRAIILAQAAKAAIDERAHQVELAAGLPDLLAHKTASGEQLARLLAKKVKAHQAELEACKEAARPIVAKAAAGTEGWQAGFIEISATAKDVPPGSNAVKEFFSRLRTHTNTLPEIHAPLLAIREELRTLAAGADFDLVWDEIGGNDPRLTIVLTWRETTHCKFWDEARRTLLSKKKIYCP